MRETFFLGNRQFPSSVSSLLRRAFGEQSETFKAFANEIAKQDDNYTLARMFPRLKGIFLSTKEQFKGDYLFDIRTLVHAEIFDNELDQAVYFQEGGWKTPAAVIAGAVLESSLREICDQTVDATPSDKINAMNDTLKDSRVVTSCCQFNRCVFTA